MRSVITLDILGQRLVGTAHLPGIGSASEHGSRGLHHARRIGLLLLNAGRTPRAGNSDLSAHLADSVAALGFPAFRVDLAGLGDSPGEVPAYGLEFWRHVLAGRNDHAALEIVAKLKRDHGLEGLILGGLCAGAVTSLRAADLDPSGIAGLLLLEPNFRLAMTVDPTVDVGTAQEPVTRAARLARKLEGGLSAKRWLYFLSGENALARALSPMRPLFRRWLTKLVGHVLPPDTNVAMVLCWQRVMARSIPTLLLTAEGKTEERYCQRILASIPTADRSAVIHTSIPDTNHVFTSGNGRALSLQSVCRWITHICDGVAPEGASPIRRGAPGVVHGGVPQEWP